MKRFITAGALVLLVPLLWFSFQSTANAVEPDPDPDFLFRPSTSPVGVTANGGAASTPVTQDIVVDAGRTLTVRCRTWWQTQGNIAWKEKHIGKMCYNGWNVWVWSRTGFVSKGYHYCDKGWGTGFVIDVTTCSIERQDGYTGPGAGYFIRNHDYYKVSGLVKGFPIWASHHMHANVFPSGTITFHWDS